MARQTVLIKPRGGAGIDLLRPFGGVLFQRGISEAVSIADQPTKVSKLRRAILEALSPVDVITGNAITGSLTITTTSLSSATVGTAYSDNVDASGGVTPYVFSIDTDNTTSGWVQINSATGDISGGPVAAESQTVKFRVTDSATPTPNTTTATFTIPTASRTGFVPNITALTSLSAGGSNATAYDALNVPAMAAGSSYTDPVTGISIVKVTDATHPSSAVNWVNEYSTMGLQISQAWGPSLNKYTIFILNGSATGGGNAALVDYTFGGTLSNYRSAPAGEGDICFSRLPGEAQILYYCTSTHLNRYDTSSSSLANTGSFPYAWTTLGGSGNNWLQFNRKHTWATALSSSGGTNNFTAIKIGAGNGVADGHTQNAITGVSSNEGYSGYNDIAFVEGSGASDYTWDLNANSLTHVTYSGTLTVQFHSPSMPGYTPWVETNQGGGVEPIHRITDAGVFSTPCQGSWYYGSVHISGHWTQSQAASAQWALMSCWNKGNPVSNTAKLDFNNAFVDMNSGNIFILCGAYSFGDNSGTGYRPQPHTTISDDGLIFMFTSDMHVSGGRTDVFVGEVPRH